MSLANWDCTLTEVQAAGWMLLLYTAIARLLTPPEDKTVFLGLLRLRQSWVRPNVR